MPLQASLFLPPNIFRANSSYAASLLGSNGNTSTLAIRCMAASTSSNGYFSTPSCGPNAPVSTITVAPTTFAMTTLSVAHSTVYTLTETCMIAPAVSTAACNVSANTGIYAPFHLNAAQYVSNILPVNISNDAAETTTTGGSPKTSIVMGKTMIALLVLCAISFTGT